MHKSISLLPDWTCDRHGQPIFLVKHISDINIKADNLHITMTAEGKSWKPNEEVLYV